MPNAEIENTTVKAEDAPVGVQLWPTRSTYYAAEYTLHSVTIHRYAHGADFVLWTFENGKQRRFAIGEDVAIQLPRT
jgi:hypothetical protein